MLSPKAYLNTPIGWLEISGTDEGIKAVRFIQMMNDIRSCCPSLISYMNVVTEQDKLTTNGLPETVNNCVLQLDEYFRGERKEFDLKLNFKGTDFRKRVWAELLNISYGETASYGEIADRIGDEKASRAVGNANNKNPIPIIIPCHRVIGSDGKLSGYGGGIWRKKWLLDFEKNNSALS